MNRQPQWRHWGWRNHGERKSQEINSFSKSFPWELTEEHRGTTHSVHDTFYVCKTHLFISLDTRHLHWQHCRNSSSGSSSSSSSSSISAVTCASPCFNAEASLQMRNWKSHRRKSSLTFHSPFIYVRFINNTHSVNVSCNNTLYYCWSRTWRFRKIWVALKSGDVISSDWNHNHVFDGETRTKMEPCFFVNRSFKN